MKKNLIILGASGGLSNAVLQKGSEWRSYFEKVVLLDKSNAVLKNPTLNHDLLNYTFIQHELKLPSESESKKAYHDLLREHEISVVLDLSDLDSMPFLEATNELAISYINTGMNGEYETLDKLIYEVLSKRELFTNASHILYSGMNPGVVNTWVRDGIEKYGKPEEVIHFEYDTSTPKIGWLPIMTWSILEFLVETSWEPAGYMDGKGKFIDLLPTGLYNRYSLEEILKPIYPLEKYPNGMYVLHEENMTIAEQYDIPSKFIYAVNMETMDYLVNINETRKVETSDLINGNNTTIPLKGSDFIGVLLKYPNHDVYYWNEIRNEEVQGTNATYTQVAVGVFAALQTMAQANLEKKIHFPEDLYGTSYSKYIFEHMVVEQKVMDKDVKKTHKNSFNSDQLAVTSNI